MTFPAGKRGRVDREDHRDGWFIDLDMREGCGILGARHRLTDVDAFDAGDRQNIAGVANRFIDTLEPFKRIQLRYFGLLQDTVEFDDTDLIAQSQRAVKDSHDRKPAEVV